jgi:hypothetical protein
MPRIAKGQTPAGSRWYQKNASIVPPLSEIGCGQNDKQCRYGVRFLHAVGDSRAFHK